MMPAPAQPPPATGPLRPKAVLLDVNQTLFPLEPLRQRFGEVGLHGPQDLEVTARDSRQKQDHRLPCCRGIARNPARSGTKDQVLLNVLWPTMQQQWLFVRALASARRCEFLLSCVLAWTTCPAPHAPMIP